MCTSYVLIESCASLASATLKHFCFYVGVMTVVWCVAVFCAYSKQCNACKPENKVRLSLVCVPMPFAHSR